MIDLDVIESTNSDFCSPVVLVQKKDGSNRFCVDFMKLNDCTFFDSEPIPNSEVIFSQIQNSKYLSHIDLTKGYWQVPMDEHSKKYTAFSTGGHVI